MNRWVAAGVVAGSAFAGGLTSELLFASRAPLAAQSRPPLPAPPPVLPETPDRPALTTETAPAELFERVIRKVGPAVVAVDAVKSASATASPAADKKGNKPTEESGSGMMLRFEGFRGTFVVTNNHVVSVAKADQVTVTLADGRIFRPDVLRADPESDIALLRLAAEGLPTVPLADSNQVRVGQWVLAFGSPFGLNQTVTHGIVSARDRGQISLGNTIRIKEFLQTDAAINPGSSGGPLVDMNGAVIGVNTAIASNNGNNSGVSFSIPSNLVSRVARQLLERGTVARGYLGLQLAPSLEPAAALRLGLDRVWGALVETVHPDGPAAAAGLQPGDVVLKLDSVEIRDENQLINLISSLPAGQRVRLSIWRARRPQTIDAVISAWPGTTTAMRQ
jgi:serine protease Do